jgi:hypothetical protein
MSFHLHHRIPLALVFLLALAVPCRVPAGEVAAPSLQPAQLHAMIERMKSSLHGPFARIRWFCADGSILPPEEGACSEHGGGVQHGEWSSATRAIRAQGYQVATLLTDLNTLSFLGAYPQLDTLRQVLLEQFLVRNDDGWVFRRARYYRGALQVEDERAGARVLLLGLLQDPDWKDSSRYLLLREAARLLPVSQEPPASAQVRKLAIEIADADPGFQNLRIKLHGLPDASDPQRVRDYVAKQGVPELAQQYQQLAAALDTLYAPRTGDRQLEELAAESHSRSVRRTLHDLVERLDKADTLAMRLQVAAQAAVQLRQAALDSTDYNPPDQLRLLQANLALEQEVYALGNQLIEAEPNADRYTRLHWLRSLGLSLFASGLLSQREWESIDQQTGALDADQPVRAGDYYDTLHYLARVPQWAQRALEFQFGPTVQQWLDLTPLASHLIPDRLRGSPLLSYTRVLDGLLEDANRLLGVKQYVFGAATGAGLRALNPGLARGRLLAAPRAGEGYREDGIYLLPSTTPELPPIAGILTSGEGNSLSHVQLLARNLGIPNVVVDNSLLERIRKHLGENVVLAVSAHGAVRIEADGQQWDAIFGRQDQPATVVIRPDPGKLDLADTELLPLARIRATDSGRIVGPKAANLGELKHYYPQAVNPGVVIPFGVFRELLNQPLQPGGPPVFEWMRTEYTRLRGIADPAQRARDTQHFLARLRDWITRADPGASFRTRLQDAMQAAFGDAGQTGVFVRSDTNVEDLPGFSGAGLNLTLPNVVGFDNVLQAISRVWASPFTERAYAWRQARMDQPEHVYPAVLLLKTFASEKSGVMVTTDVENGDRHWLSIATSEGVGGAVEGQAAEELRVNRNTGAVRLLSQATAPLRAEPEPSGGMRKVPASGRDTLLQPAEIEQLRALAADVEQRFPMPAAADRRPAPADIEFGFRAGKLELFQIRPFVESRRARRSQYLIDMDRDSARGRLQVVDLHQPPEAAAAP